MGQTLSPRITLAFFQCFLHHSLRKHSDFDVRSIQFHPESLFSSNLLDSTADADFVGVHVPKENATSYLFIFLLHGCDTRAKPTFKVKKNIFNCRINIDLCGGESDTGANGKWSVLNRLAIYYTQKLLQLAGSAPARLSPLSLALL